MAHSTFTFFRVQTQTMSFLDYFHFRNVRKKKVLLMILVIIMKDTGCIAEEEVSIINRKCEDIFIFELKN